ncbi:MAG: RHS repeat-associated core domain-containing protein [Acidobacteriaceae bacterium]|nr:RHS repeat-associated core domain-containing protein [Acidobacteriaceae bacterium]
MDGNELFSLGRCLRYDDWISGAKTTTQAWNMSTMYTSLSMISFAACASHFTGKERDTESGLDYFGARYYGSSMGRWMSPDPLNLTDERLLNPQTLNKYGYATDNPLKYVDDDGKDITVFYEKSGALDPTSFGHIMFVAENQQTGDAAAMSFGPVHDADYGLTPLGAPVNSTNSFISPGHTFSADDIRQNFASITIQTSPEEAQKVIEFIRNMTPGANPYMLFKNNCTTTCVQALKILGLLPSKSSIITPKSLWKTLSKTYLKSNSTNFFGQQKAPTNGVNYGYQPGYDPFQLMDLLNKQCTDSWDNNSNTLTSTCH